MSKFEFSPKDWTETIDDFGNREFITSHYFDHEDLTERIAIVANAKIAPLLARLEELEALQKEIENAPLMSGIIEPQDAVVHFIGPYARYENATHKAKLVCIEKIK